MIEDLVLAINGGRASDAAADWVITRSDTHDLEVELTVVMEVTRLPHGDRVVESEAPYVEMLRRAADRMNSTRPLLVPRVVVRRGDPARTLIAASEGADLLVVGSGHPGRITGVVHGTVPLAVAGRTRCPLVVVPAEWPGSGGGVICGWTDDGTSDVAAEFAARQARADDTTLTLVHAWRVPALVAPAREGAGLAVAGLAAATEQALEEAAQRVRDAHPGLVVSTRIEAGSSARVLVDEALDARLVVLGSHGRGALGGLILGSVSHDVLMNMPSPVAIVPAPGEPIVVLPEIVPEDL